VRNAAIIVAGGTGVRMGGHQPKQMVLLNGSPVLWHVLSVFQRASAIERIVCVLEQGLFERKAECGISRENFSKLDHVVVGGENRTQSVWNGLAVLEKIDVVLVHDGVRPLVTEALIKRALAAAQQHNAAVPVIECSDTLKEVSPEGYVISTLPRHHIHRVQTPQAFSFDLLKESYRRCLADNVPLTDDAAAVEYCGQRVHIFEGDTRNIKITYKQDLDLASILMVRSGDR